MKLSDHLPGYPGAERIAIGMQGAVFRLGRGKIAKVWFHAGTAELRRLADFYASVDTPSIRTPEILEVHDRSPYRVTVEVELPGVPLYTVAPEFGTPARDCVLDVLEELAAVTTTPTLAVLDELKPYALWSPRIREIEAAFDQATVGRFGYDPEVLRIYRAVHLLLIANAHDADPYERDDAVGLAAALLN